MKAKVQLTRNQKLFAVMLRSQVMFMRHFFADEMTMEPSTRQKLMWNDVSQRVLNCTSRKVGKTMKIEGRILRRSLVYRNRTRLSERMFAAPGDQQLNPTLLRLMSKIHGNPLLNLLFSYNKNDKVLKCATNVMWHTRIDGTSGDDRNMVGLRLDEIIYDEAAFTNRACHKSRMQSALPGCMWEYCGVPNSVRHTPFWELDQTQTGKYWSHHKMTSYDNPILANQESRERLKSDYADSPQDYITQVLGQWGEEVYSSFPRESIAVSEATPYAVAAITNTHIPESFDSDMVSVARLMAALKIPKLRQPPAQFALGMDYGFHQDPSEIVVSYRETFDSMTWIQLMRVHMKGIDPLAQARLLHFLCDGLGRERVGRICIDLASGGVAIALELTRLPRYGEWYRQVISDFAPNATMPITDPTDPNKILRIRKKQWATQRLQLAFMNARSNAEDIKFFMGNDEEMIHELMDTRERKTEYGNTIYIPRMLSGKRAVDHCTDALRCTMSAINDLQNAGQVDYDFVEYLEDAGWAGNPFGGPKWQPSWDRGTRIVLGN